MSIRPPSDIFDYLEFNMAEAAFFWRRATANVLAGSKAGSTYNTGYRNISFRGRKYQEHRLVWLAVHGEWPPELIDHVNANPSDNRPENLRLASQGKNNANRKNFGKWKKGVCRSKKRFAAAIYVDKQVIRLGTYTTEDEAHAAYCKAAIQYYGEFARFE